MTRRAVELRRYRAEDNQVLSDIWLRASARAHSFFTTEQLAEQRERVSKLYLPNAETWVACEAAVQVGFIGLIDDFIGGLFVDPQHQGGGIGRTLVQHAITLKGTLTLEVYASNTGARTFYERMGFREIGRRPIDDNGLPFALITMRSPA